jgi:hypothetical protein
MKLALLCAAVSVTAQAQVGSPQPAPQPSPPGPAAGQPTAGTTAAPTTAVAGQTTPGAGLPVSPIEQAEHAIIVDGFTYMDFEWVEYDPNSTFSGRNNGFRIADMRLEMQGRPTGRFGFDVSIDAAVGQRTPANTLLGSNIIALEDGNVWFDILPELRLTVGQFVVPFGAEALLPDDDLPFVRRSIVTGGIQAPESNTDVPGVWGNYCAFSACRALGLSLRYRMPHDRPGFSIEIMGANGNGQNQIVNDNNQFLILGRFEGWLDEHVTLGLNAYYDPRTVVNTVNNQGYLYDETDYAAGADVVAHLGGLRLMGMFLWKETQFVTTGAPLAHTWGVVGQALYTLPSSLLGFQVGYRFAYYEPNTAIPASELYENDFVVAYPFPHIPVRVLAQVSLRAQDPANAVNNDGVDVMLQALF